MVTIAFEVNEVFRIVKMILVRCYLTYQSRSEIQNRLRRYNRETITGCFVENQNEGLQFGF